MQLRKSTAFIASAASFFFACNAAATSLRGFDEDNDIDEILTEDKPGTFLLVSDTMITWSPWPGSAWFIVAACYCYEPANS